MLGLCAWATEISGMKARKSKTICVAIVLSFNPWTRVALHTRAQLRIANARITAFAGPDCRYIHRWKTYQAVELKEIRHCTTLGYIAA
jgi:hypothetical protein